MPRRMVAQWTKVPSFVILSQLFKEEAYELRQPNTDINPSRWPQEGGCVMGAFWGQTQDSEHEMIA